MAQGFITITSEDWTRMHPLPCSNPPNRDCKCEGCVVEWMYLKDRKRKQASLAVEGK